MGLIASVQGKEKISKKLKEKGWSATDERFLKAVEEELSKALSKQPGQRPASTEATLSEETLKRFVYRKDPIKDKNFKACAAALGLKWEDLIDAEEADDWNLVPVEPHFYGRTKELETLRGWLSPGQRLIILHGLGGMGKTALAAKFVEKNRKRFSRLVWQKFTYNQSVEELIANLLYKLCPNNDALPSSTELRQDALLKRLDEKQILMVLDEQSAQIAPDHYRSQLEQYSEFWKLLGTRGHKSTVVLTTREKPIDMTIHEDAGIRPLSLAGVDEDAGRHILRSKGLTFDESHGSELICKYDGNPLALKLISGLISKYCRGRVENFLGERIAIPQQIKAILERQMQFIQPSERELLIYLTNSGLATPEELRAELPDISRIDFFNAISALERSSLIFKVSPKEGEPVQYDLSPLVREFSKQYFAEPPEAP